MSVVWNLYKKMKGESGEDLAVCKICSKTVRIPKSKTTTNLLSHLRESHKEEMEDAQTTTLKENTIVETQPKLDELFKRKISSSTKRRLDHKVALLVAKGSLPLNIVSLDVFKDLLATLNPSYSPPCTKTLLSIMRDQVKALDEANKVVCKQEGCNIAVTVDSWSSSNANCSLLAITGHITGADITDRRNILIDCIPLQGESHTAVVLEAKFRESIERLGISPAQISCIVADGASVMKAMASNLDLRYVQCCAHVINLAVRAALESDAAKMAINNVKKIVSRLNRSPKVKSLYKRFLKEAGLPLALPVTDCPTRWGSTYTMVCDVLNSVCYQDSCVSMYIPVGKILIASTKKNCQAARREAKQFGECLLSKLWHYFDEWFEDEDLSIAAFCDPRFAFLDTVLPAESWRTTVEKFIASKAKSTEPKEIEDLLDRTAIHHGERDDGEAPVWNLLTTQPSSSRESTTTEDEIQIEVQQYAVLLKNRGHRTNRTPSSGGGITARNSP
ncbi:BED zinc finger [Ancylostoma ceylanicum]|uniref:BED zinc finger n=1 Tax=Ancylostoma ceylanicum TaxID=53326 RepID=A0A0D6LA91_9BILA|nr:BED zinc finger [Ancylostoma ceylanicum]